MQSSLLNVIALFSVASQVTDAFVTDTVRKQALCLESQFLGGTSYCSGVGQANPATEYFWNAGNTDGFSLSVHGGIVYVVFRATDEGGDWFGVAGNLNCGTSPFPILGTTSVLNGISGFHNGFVAAYNSLDNILFTQLTLKLSSSCAGCPVVFAGHSRGGALASMAMIQYLLDPAVVGTSAGHLRSQPQTKMRVQTHGEPHFVYLSAVVGQSQWTTVTNLQNKIKERHVVWGQALGLCASADPVTYAGELCGLNYFGHIGRIVSSCDGTVGGHGLNEHYIWRAYNKGEVTKYFQKCWKADASNEGQEEKKCWHRYSWGWKFECDTVAGSVSSSNESSVTATYGSWLSYVCSV